MLSANLQIRRPQHPTPCLCSRINRISKEGKYCNRILPRAEMSCIALEINLGPRGSKSRKNEYFPDIDEKKILVGIM